MIRNTVILGVDPGTKIMGYGLICAEGNGYDVLEYGCLHPKAKIPLPEKYLYLFEAIGMLMDQYRPDAVAVEDQFVSKNMQSALKLSIAKGVVLLAAAKRKIPTFEYTPSAAKKSITKTGSASKELVQKMVDLLFKIPRDSLPEDASDALAVAWCHLQSLRKVQR